MADPKKTYYWDTCIWLALINEEAGRVDCCRYVIAEARKGNVQIWTSAFTLAEVFKKSIEGKSISLPEIHDLDFERYIEQEFLTLVQVDYDIGVLARRLLRRHPKLKKPADAIHLATAALNNLDEFHTYDDKNLTPLSGLVKRQDAVGLPIRFPPADPQFGLFAAPAPP